MHSYNPLRQPDPEVWLALDEMERIHLVSDFHLQRRVKIPSITGHAVIHSIVETQAAMGTETPVAQTLERLQAEGLDRHDGIHAIGSVLAEKMQNLMADGSQMEAPNEEYWAALENLSAANWKGTS